MIGQKFGRLTVVAAHGHLGPRLAWLCSCDCGGSIVRAGTDLRASVGRYVIGCGCTAKAAYLNNGRSNRTHGLSKHRAYGVWRQMLRRCYDQACTDYPAWGGRGIRVCDAWHDVATFIAWAESSGYRDGVTIERADNNGNYSPENCCWIPNCEQASNTRRVRWLEVGGERRRIDDWASITGVKYRTIINRLSLGWPPERAVHEPAVKGRNQAGMPRSAR